MSEASIPGQSKTQVFSDPKDPTGQMFLFFVD